ncbi:hypothetical protein FA13DRAFT_1800255 [Coprinellus micaceus]|uniref:Uncharacterized protein n=1 Tax=Coprinellus micaceus TaxID=71717 RepID=A0A4Y7SGY8_COPMI|nr:hypothetical protein FA13DRAFT_1800255 [Coprinellus micaceus]
MAGRNHPHCAFGIPFTILGGLERPGEDIQTWTVPHWNTLVLVLSLRMHQACSTLFTQTIEKATVKTWLTCFESELNTSLSLFALASILTGNAIVHSPILRFCSQHYSYTLWSKSNKQAFGELLDQMPPPPIHVEGVLPCSWWLTPPSQLQTLLPPEDIIPSLMIQCWARVRDCAEAPTDDSIIRDTRLLNMAATSAGIYTRFVGSWLTKTQASLDAMMRLVPP